VKVGEKVTLMKWGNVRIVGIEQQDNGLRLIGEDLPDDKDYKETKKFTWLAKEGGLVRNQIALFSQGGRGACGVRSSDSRQEGGRLNAALGHPK
jgi:hypothetical protein